MKQLIDETVPENIRLKEDLSLDACQGLFIMHWHAVSYLALLFFSFQLLLHFH